MPSTINETLTVVFWSITYLLIVFAGFRSRAIRRVSMPYAAGVLNFAWEICALYWVPDFWGYTVWLAIDLLIVYFGFRYLNGWAKRVAYFSAIVICTAGIFVIFNTIPDGIIYSVYTIDLLMAICYLVERKQLSPIAKIPIAVAKLLGDFFAGILFSRYTFVVIVSFLVFVCNAVYLYLCIQERQSEKEPKKLENELGGETYAG